MAQLLRQGGVLFLKVAELLCLLIDCLLKFGRILKTMKRSCAKFRQLLQKKKEFLDQSCSHQALAPELTLGEPINLSRLPFLARQFS